MADIFQEVDEALQRERMESFWRRWGPWLIAGAVVVVLITAAVVAYKNMREQELTQATQQLMQARDADKPVAALSTYAGEANNPHKTYARLLAAGHALEDEDTQQAESLYTNIVGDEDAPGELRDLAHVMAVRTGIDHDTANADKLLSRLKPVMTNSESPWNLHARLQAAVVHGQLKGAYDKAGEMLSELTDRQEVPRSLGQRARRIAHIYDIRASRQSGDDE